MIRTLGFIVGSGLVAWALIWFADMQLPNETRDIEQFLATPVSLEIGPEKGGEKLDVGEMIAEAIEQASSALVDEVDDEVSIPEAPIKAASTVQVTDKGGAVEKTEEAKPLTTEFFFGDSQAPALHDVGPPVPDDETFAIEEPQVNTGADVQWYVFWRSFRSEISATGFVEQLERVTGLNYRVVKVKAGVYQVAFAHVNDTDKDTNLARIEDATGLRLTDAR